MFKITSTLKTILSNQGFNENHLFQKAAYLVNKVDRLHNHFASTSAVENKKTAKKIVSVNKQYKNTENIGHKDVLKKTRYLKKLILQIKTQQGISTNASLTLPRVNDVKVADIYSEFWQLDLGISEMELFWAIDTQAVNSVKVNNKQLIDVYVKLITLEEKLLMLSRYSIQVNSRNNG
jgi:translation elongation factor EF-G